MVEKDKSVESRGGERQEEGQEPSETSPPHPSRDQTRRMTLEGAVEPSVDWTQKEPEKVTGMAVPQDSSPSHRSEMWSRKKWMSVQNTQGTKNVVPMREYERHLIILKYSC